MARPHGNELNMKILDFEKMVVEQQEDANHIGESTDRDRQSYLLGNVTESPSSRGGLQATHNSKQLSFFKKQRLEDSKRN